MPIILAWVQHWGNSMESWSAHRSRYYPVFFLCLCYPLHVHVESLKSSWSEVWSKKHYECSALFGVAFLLPCPRTVTSIWHQDRFVSEAPGKAEARTGWRARSSPKQTVIWTVVFMVHWVCMCIHLWEQLFHTDLHEHYEKMKFTLFQNIDVDSFYLGLNVP